MRRNWKLRHGEGAACESRFQTVVVAYREAYRLLWETKTEVRVYHMTGGHWRLCEVLAPPAHREP